MSDKVKNTVNEQCRHFGLCGGCVYQDIDYKTELELKRNTVLDLFEKNNISLDTNIEIAPSPNEKYYRNKMEFSFGDDGIGSQLTLGMRKRRSFYEVVSLYECNIVCTDFIEILQTVQQYFRDKNISFYHKRKHEGVLRHLVIRKTSIGEILVNLVTTSNYTVNNDFITLLTSLKLKGNIMGIIHTINDSLGDVVKSDETKLLYGRNYIVENILGLSFKISPFSFFQTNSKGAESLYSIVKEFAGNITNKIVYDLYCGIGTISQILAKDAMTVIGIEIVTEAVKSAKENAEQNNLGNCCFIEGDVLKRVDEQKNPDIIVIDPPREGINPKALKKIIQFQTEKIVYVSCNPKTLVRDLIVLIENGYYIEKIKLIDMFARTAHVETICLMSRVN